MRSSLLAQPIPDVISRRLGPSAILVHLATNRIFELNETGVFIWECMTRAADSDDIVQQLTSAFEIDAHTAGHELARLQDRLVEQGLAEWPA